jgi:hypothetical protein
MAGIDKLISTGLSLKIKKEIGLDVLKKVERELFLEHGMSIKLSIEHFQKFINIFKKNSNININKFEKDCINKIIKIRKKDGKYLISVVDSKLVDSIFEFLGDSESRKIISILLENEYTIPKILKESKIPKTSGYRKIEDLLISGFLIETGKILSESKKISKIRCIFQEVSINVKEEKITINGIISKKLFEKSTSMKSIIDAFEQN